MIDYPVEDFPVDVVVSTMTSSGGRRVTVLTITNGDDRRPATLGPLGLERLGNALDVIAKDPSSTDAVVITGNGRTFCAGANLDTLASPRSLNDALAFAREGHRVLAKLSHLVVPTIAAINGIALGGGLELALHCTYRVAQVETARLGLPEIGLGLIPGWGGATLLPRIIGLAPALGVMVTDAITGKHLGADRALELGLVDAVTPDVMTGAMLFVDGLAQSNSRPDTSRNHDAAVSLIDEVLERQLGRPGNPIDALRQLSAVIVSTIDATDTVAFAAEDQALATLMMTAEFRRRLYAFRENSSASKPPAGSPSEEPRPLSRVGVIGAGLMASQISLAFAESLAVPVVFSDVSQDRLDAAIDRMGGWLDARISKKTLSESAKSEILARLRPTLSMSDFADCDLVIEAVFEDLVVKKTVLTELEAIVRPDAIIASNTSSLSIDAMAGFVSNPERVAGIHFFNPVASMKLVEVVRGPRESGSTLATAIHVARTLRKTPVVVADKPGFVVNRLLSTFLGEVLRLVEAGIAPNAVSEAIEPLRLPMTPFALIDLIGRMVTLKMMESVRHGAPERFFVGTTLPVLTDKPVSSSIAADLESAVTATSHMTAVAIHDSIVDALAREVHIMLAEQVVHTASDIDLCMMSGAGWPAAIGGLTPYLDGCGASERATGIRFHPEMNFA